MMASCLYSPCDSHQIKQSQDQSNFKLVPKIDAVLPEVTVDYSVTHITVTSKDVCDSHGEVVDNIYDLEEE